MALNGSGTFHRTSLDEAEDVGNQHRNVLAETWKDWPNEAAFDKLEEHRGPITLKVKGDIPPWASGSLFRTGPGQCRVADTVKGTHYVSHWFDGFAHTHRFDIDAPTVPGGETTVTYSSRRQSEDYVARIKKKGWRTGVSFGQKSDPCVGIFAKVMGAFESKLTDYGVTVQPNVPGMPKTKPSKSGHRTSVDNLYIASDIASMRRVDTETLEPIGPARQSAFHPELKGRISCAHAQRDPETGDWFNFNLDFGKLPTYRVFRVNAKTGKTDILATISSPELRATYIHSFFLTQNYVVLCLPSSHLQWNGLGIMWKRNVLEAIESFDEAKLCRWIVVDRRHGRGVVARFSTPAAFFFHSVNAFEEVVEDENGRKKTDLVLDYAEYANLDIIKGFYYDILLNRNDAAKNYWMENDRFKKLLSYLTRQRFTMPDPDAVQNPDFSAKAQQDFVILNPHAGELPTINPNYQCKRHRYVYSLTNRGLNIVVDSIAKTDVDTREALIWAGPQGHMPGEPIFVPRPGGIDEDDGVLLSVVIDCISERSYLLCLDAKTMEEMGRAETNFSIAMGFHGIHVPMSG